MGPKKSAKILCCTKRDIREQNPNDPKCITDEEGSQAASDYRFLSYTECSAKLFQDCDTVFAEAIRTAKLVQELNPTAKVETSGCCNS